MNSLVQNLVSLQIKDFQQVGGKAASLARMIQAGLPVPPGLVILSQAFDQSGISVQAWQKAQKMILKFREEDPQISFAVRSSAISEDSDLTSFAGEFESFLNASEDMEIFSAINQVYESRLTERVKIYSENKGISDSHLISVILQQLIPAESSGVMFTANPLTGIIDEVMINAAWGLGESIVDGMVNTDNIIVKKVNKKIIKKEVVKKEKMTILSEHGTQLSRVSEDQQMAQVLSQKQVLELLDLGLKIEKLFGKPMDIEWVYAKNNFQIVQARPITSLPSPTPPLPKSWRLPQGAYMAMRNNIVEMMIEPLTPLFKTLGLSCVNQSMGSLMDDFFDQTEILPERIIIPVNEYAYYNGSLKPLAIFRVTFGAGKIMKRMFSGAVERWTEKGRPEYVQLVNSWENRDLSFMENPELLEGVYSLCTAAIDAYGALVSGVIPAAWINEGLFTLVYNTLIKRKNDPKAAEFLLGFDSLPLEADKNLYDLSVWIKAKEDLREYFYKTSSAEIQLDFYQNNPADKVTPENWQVWHNKFKKHLKKFGHTIYNLDFANPLPADDPGQLIETIKLFLDQKIQDPYQRQQNLVQQREIAAQTIQKRLSGFRKKWFSKRLESAQRFAPLREDGLADIGLAYPILRRILLELGKRLSEASLIATATDIFWLEENELTTSIVSLRVLKPVKPYTEIIKQRKLVWKRAKELTPPLSLSFFPKKIKQERLNRKARKKNFLKGVAASPGITRGKARILSGPEDFDSFLPGEILVTAITTPAWTPLFARAAGVVTDIGGPLSHGSIVAREYGIPAVLGTGDATRRIRNGQIIEINGNTGTINLSP